MFDRIDLHTHSNCSDGLLGPAALVERAAARQVQLLALTDHDTLAGCEAAKQACAEHDIQFLPGIEMTATWRGREIHVVGLNVAVENDPLQRHTIAVLAQRQRRLREMSLRLTAAGLPGESMGDAALAAAAPTRMHLARELVARGYASDIDAAFKRWLGRGQRAYVPADWPALAAVVTCIAAAGGLAVLAHPHRYQVAHGALRELCAEFKTAGGAGIEVSLAGMSPGDADRAAALARRYQLAGSIGSDFHEPDVPWRPLGRFAKLADRITPITTRLGLD